MNTHFHRILIGLLLCAVLLLPNFSFAQGSLGTRRVLPPVTRAEAATSLIHARFPSIPPLKNDGRFPDLPRGVWYEQSLLAAEKFGIIRADPRTHELRPDASVNRAEILKMAALTFGLEMDLSFSYRDVRKSDWFSPYAGIAQSYALFPKDSDQTLLKPAKYVTREEASAIVATILEARAHKSGELSPEEERSLAREQARRKLQIYLVISTRRQKVDLVDPSDQPPQVKPEPRLTQPTQTGQTLSQLRREIVILVNDAREKEGLPPVKMHAALEQSAQAYAEDMAERGYFSHVNPEGQTLRDRIAATGYYDRSFSKDCFCIKGFSLGENLARGQKTPIEAMRDWMESPSHRSAILNREYTDVGIGASAGYWVQHFGGILLPGEGDSSSSAGE